MLNKRQGDVRNCLTSLRLDREQGILEGSILDITDRRQAEAALRDAEIRYHLLFEHSPDGIVIIDPATARPLEFNETAHRQLGYSREEFARLSISDLDAFETPEETKAQITNVIREGRKDFETLHRTRQGEIRNIQVKAQITEILGHPVYHCIWRDITERKRTEEALRTSLQEKEILIREVHHRVKNNMQVISGLLDLQASSSGNPELTEMLDETQSRIRSMALIHEKLYDSKDFTRIDLAGYVRTLSQELFQAYKINPGEIDLIIQTDGAVYVDISKAIPCGLILNELISNALKHAFPGNEPGKLEIIIRETKDTEVEILVRDNGLGIPDDVDIHKPQTMGLHLVNGLVIHQLDGQIEVIRDAGTEFRIKFPLLFVENKGVV
jgi:PAS domain S-box-containing protein